ncbi:ABC transporter substrate-binding protein [Actinoplanes sp. L3-i22]|uniref:ABC transporter substrate-binding protein n=1 Tax=Actinoplanes sp. L3-i22 TaxID=2836373 RepID=UPI001C75A464|nr:extracellular solute-binding protein [Actinoplanes sp. L3-i22]BCY08436.1 sugar ABC transporter substrate-binding protein [Actinoplanes sp. L3-i22]
MKRRRLLALTSIAGLALTAGACGDSAPAQTSGPVTITVNNMPPETEALQRKNFLADVAEFEKLHTDITIDPKEGKMDPATFSARLAGGQLENAFYVYFTDPAGLIARKQAADITPYLKEFPSVSQIKPNLLDVFGDGKGRTFGLPEGNYTMGLVYNRALFQKAGLDPDKPPATWDEVRDYAKKIAALGGGVNGYGDYSKNNTGGWHFTAEMYTRGGDVAARGADGKWTAAFNNDTGRAVLQQLHDMRFADKSMGERQLLEWADLLQQMGAGKLGMYLATADNIPTIVAQYKGKAEDYGFGPVPGGQGTLGGGGGYMFSPKSTPAQVKAAMAWVLFRHANPDRIEFGKQRDAADKQPVGLPEPNIFTGAAGQAYDAASKKYANVPTQNFAPFVAAQASIPLKLEPPDAQKIYAILDPMMAAALTKPDADVTKLLADAEKQVNAILATVQQ